MKNLLNFILTFIVSTTMCYSQFAEPSVSGAYFANPQIPQGTSTTLNFSFVNTGPTAIPSNSIELLVSAPATYYRTDGVTMPSGSGASLFAWTYVGQDTWRGVNNASIPGSGGGLVTIDYNGILMSSSFETTNINVSILSSFNQFDDNSANNSQQPELQIIAPIINDCSYLTPEIGGDLFGCSGDLLSVNVDTFTQGNTYTWSVSPPAQILVPINGTAIVELPDTSKGTFVLTVTEMDGQGCSATVSTNVVIEQNHALVCDDLLNVSLDEDCEIDFTADIILEGQLYPNESYTVYPITSKGDTLDSPIMGMDLIGQTIKISVVHDCSENSCWGRILLEDKAPPTVDCPDQVIVSCFDTSPIALPVATDNCDKNVPVKIISNELDNNECEDDYTAVRTIIYIAEDDHKNVSERCTTTVYYEKANFDSLKCPMTLGSIDDGKYLDCKDADTWDKNGNGYPDIDETGYPTIEGKPIKESNGICKINMSFTDNKIDVCDQTYKIVREFVILDWCSGEIATCTQIIKVADLDGPVVTCPPDSLFNTYVRPYECLADFEVPAPTVIFDCSDSITYEVGYLLADTNGDPPKDGEYITTNVVGNQEDGYVIEDLPLGRTWVRYRVYDGCGNYTDCFTEIDVLDRVPPVAICDQNTVVGLTNLDIAQVFAVTFDDGSYDNCGDVTFEVARMRSGCGIGTAPGEYTLFCCDDVGRTDLQVQLIVTDESGNSNTCMVNVVVQDKSNPIITCPDNVTIDCKAPSDIATLGEATAIDNCPGVKVEFVNESTDKDQCHVGTITRTWKATDKSNRTATCSQRIRVVDNTPFKGSDIDWTPVRNRTLDMCMALELDPDITGRPAWSNDECSQVAASYKDEVFTILDSVCVKVLRTWTVIDWCTYNENTGAGTYSYIQTIKLTNTVDPEIKNCRDMEVCTEGPGCGGDIELFIEAEDDCTSAEDLKFLYTIDIDNDGTVDRPGGTNDLSGNYPVGKHKVVVEVEDRCGNDDKCEFILTVNDCKKPTPYCLTEIITVIMPSSEMIDIWASDFDHGSEDNCPGELKFSFSSDTTDTQRIFDCDQLGFNPLEMWVTDAAGNQDFCRVKVDIQSNGDGCEGSRFVGGTIENEGSEKMNDVTVQINDVLTNESRVQTTIGQGQFAFYGVDENNNYTLSASKNIDYLNGVSTLDLVLIQRHILGITSLDSPYKMIAADINNNKKINVSDLVSLRKLILGITNKYENNGSWMFVDKSQILDREYPWNYTNILNVSPEDIQNGKVFDFKGIKIGDVNASAKANARESIIKPRSSNPLNVTIDNISYEKGQLIKVEFKAEDAYTFLGMQSTLKFDSESLKFVGIEGGKVHVGYENFNPSQTFNGLIPISISEGQEIQLASKDVMFTIFFECSENGTLADKVSLSDDLLQSEAYDYNLEAQTINFRAIDNVEEVIGFNVYQNIPNPFVNETKIPFDLGKDDMVSLTIYDITGKVVHTDQAQFNKGRNYFTVNSSKLQSSGVLSYEVTTSSDRKIMKMIVVK